MVGKICMVLPTARREKILRPLSEFFRWKKFTCRESISASNFFNAYENAASLHLGCEGADQKNANMTELAGSAVHEAYHPNLDVAQEEAPEVLRP